ncbi:protein clmp1 [Anaeramoeba flamelloides]|uniref:Protein clmp1 n=1 Tax=Anaeramoeba flamelloides TaxID=1746091 RepID=A0AAV7YV50_9EUKA|nr:protein clmp1 [Anaeramoeba flamelloides]|eukprot:Anaeramoba_flamelloidesc29643_g1_i1.p1 GENE.c29643_g1_i1~~c29643_g1_i1.p1  ORF type:complete len:219 (-),score=58.79 c29643_g1_i1:16-651(-)
MSNKKRIYIKTVLNKDIRRFSLKPNSRIEEFQLIVQEIYKIPTSYIVDYLDNEGDHITVTNQLEFEEALHVAHTIRPKIIRFNIKLLVQIDKNTLEKSKKLDLINEQNQQIMDCTETGIEEQPRTQPDLARTEEQETEQQEEQETKKKDECESKKIKRKIEVIPNTDVPYFNELMSIAEMGFEDLDLVLKLLQKYKGDVQKVVLRLSQIKN